MGISIPLAENNLKKYKEGYDEYIKQTSKIIPVKFCWYYIISFKYI